MRSSDGKSAGNTVFSSNFIFIKVAPLVVLPLKSAPLMSPSRKQLLDKSAPLKMAFLKVPLWQNTSFMLASLKSALLAVVLDSLAFRRLHLRNEHFPHSAFSIDAPTISL